MAKTAAIQNEYGALHAAGGLQRIYITDFHFAAQQVEHVAQHFSTDIFCSQIDASKLRKARISRLIPFDYTLHDIEPDLTVIPTPGHTSGGVCYLLMMDQKRYLFTGDFLYFDGQQWIVGSKNYNSVSESLNRLQALTLRIGNSSSNPCRHNIPEVYLFQVLLYGHEIQSPIHVATIRPVPTLVKYNFVLPQTNHELQVKDRFCSVFAEI